MAATAFLIAAALIGHATASVVELNCSDNATCIENLAREFVRSVRQQKTVRLFDVFTVEPLHTRRQARSNEGLLSNFLHSHAFSFDWNDYTFKIYEDQNLSDALGLQLFESKAVKDVSEDVPKKSKSKVEEDDDDKKAAKGPAIRRRRQKKKLIQAVIPMLFGMKSAAAVMVAFAVVTVLTLKAFVASKVALLLTVAMAVKRLYESYSLGFPEALWKLARYFKLLLGYPVEPAQSMTMPMYVMPQMYAQMAQTMAQNMALPVPEAQ